jgi:hypothetical protein
MAYFSFICRCEKNPCTPEQHPDIRVLVSWCVLGQEHMWPRPDPEASLEAQTNAAGRKASNQGLESDSLVRGSSV